MNTYSKIFLALLLGFIIVISVVYLRERTVFNSETRPSESFEETTGSDEQNQTSSAEGLVNESWTWIRTETLDSEDFIASENENFILTFNEDGTVTSTTDCNSMSGIYVLDGELLSFGSFSSTLMFCEDSVEDTYAEFLSYTNSYSISDDELRLFLSRDVGTMIFVNNK